jgi:hypothetical protein
MSKAKAHYVDNKKFYTVLLQYKKDIDQAKKDKKTKPRIPEYVGECLFKIANRLSTKPNFINYTYRDEMISDGIENCISYLDNFDPEKSTNPFAYFTQIIYFAFLRRIQKERKHLYIKQKTLLNFAFEGMLVEGTEDFENFQGKIDLDNDYMTNLVRDFETKAEIKKQKNSKKAKGLEILEDVEEQ